MVLPETHCAGLQSTLLLALSFALPQLGMQAIGPCELQVLHSQIHQHRSIVLDPLKLVTRTAVVAHLAPPWKLWKQPRPWPCLHVPALGKPTAANSGPAPATGAPVVHSDVLKALSLQCLQRWRESANHIAIGRGLMFQP